MYYLLNLQNKGLKVDGLKKIGLGLGNLSKCSIVLFETRALVLPLKIQFIYPLLAVEYM
jgi:hypothetical protein